MLSSKFCDIFWDSRRNILIKLKTQLYFFVLFIKENYLFETEGVKIPSLASAPPLWSWRGPPWVWASAGSLSGSAIALASPQSNPAWRQTRCGRGAQSFWVLKSRASSFSSCETSSGLKGRQPACFKTSLWRETLSLKHFGRYLIN